MWPKKMFIESIHALYKDGLFWIQSCHLGRPWSEIGSLVSKHSS